MDDDYDLVALRGKKRKNSRTKGNTFERKISKLLNDKFNTKEFCRTPGSGAFATTHTLPSHMKVYGDLITPENFKFIIECKKGYNRENITSFFGGNSHIRAFIKQACNDSKYSNKPYLIVYQQDRSKILTIFDIQQSNLFNGLPIDKDYLQCKDIIICKFEDLLTLPNSYFLN